MLTLAYIGNGKSANRYHIPFVRTRPEKFRVKTIYSRVVESLWAPLEGVDYTTDIEKVWNDPEIDLVVVCTRYDSHYEFARTALEHGKNALIEKPFTSTGAQAKELFALAKEKGLFLQGYQNRRFDSDFLTVQKVIESGRLGDLFEIEMHFDYYRPEVPKRWGTSYSPYMSMLYGHGVHTVDQVLSYFGSPDSVHADVRQLLGASHKSDYFDLDMYYGALKVSVKSSYFRATQRPSFVIYGKQGCFVKSAKDRQEEHLKHFYLPGQRGFGVDDEEHYSTLTYYDEDGGFHEQKVVSEVGDYARFYDGIYETIVNGALKVVKDEQTIELIHILEEGIRTLTEKGARA
ncbi:MAG: Gfo/Idh/MocA family oxidoreductase [Cellulomonadaceae bacterium]|nr:Gfo/Idh/MocA family oxidoreductase [Cellulomonadaceae bacterium]